MRRMVLSLHCLRHVIPVLGILVALSLASEGSALAQPRGHRREGSGEAGGGGGGRTQGTPAQPRTRAGDRESSGGDPGGSARAIPRDAGTSGPEQGRATPAKDARTSDDSPSGNAAPPQDTHERGGKNARGEGGTTVVVAHGGYHGGGFYPWGYGGLGFGGDYGAGYWDPWWDGDEPPRGYPYADDGALRLKMKPRDAAVYIDGYFTGRVDDFDGIFERLHLAAGPHQLEIRLDGYEPLMLNIRIQPSRTLTYSGDLKKLP